MIIIKKLLKHINILFLINIVIFLCFIFLINDKVILENTPSMVLDEQENFLHDVRKIFINNLIAVIPYVIPILGAGKFLLDIYITTFSVKVFLTDNEAIKLFQLFLPHFFMEFYAMTIWVYLSWLLFRAFIIKDKNNESKDQYKHIFFGVILSLTLLLVSAIIETTERGLFL